MSNTNEVRNFNEFRKLYRSVASLIRCQSYLGDVSRKSIDKLENLARKMEVSTYVQQKEIIAVAGMQGTGKSTLIKNLYDLPDDILRISSERGEKIPVFITEKEELSDGQYKACEVYFELGRKTSCEIDVNEISRKSRRGGNTAYIELFVPYKIFCRDNAGFVLLPGFEKNQNKEMDTDYNSLMEYTLHFSKAVILATENSGIANAEIYSLMDILGKNFVPGNCIFAITKCDGLDDVQCSELKESLKEICLDSEIAIASDQIICTGEYRNAEMNDKWKQEIVDAIGSRIDYNAAKKSYLYYRPMVDELCECANMIDDSLNTAKISTYSDSPIYDELKASLEKTEEILERKLDEQCSYAQKTVSDKFAEVYGGIDDKYKKSKKLLVFNKSYSELADDRRYIEEQVKECLFDENKNSVFRAKVFENLCSKEKVNLLCETHTDLMNGGIEGEIAEKDAQKCVEMTNETLRFYLDPSIKNLPAFPDNRTPDKKLLADLISNEMEAFFLGSFKGNINPDKLGIKTSGVAVALKSATYLPKSNNPLLKAVTMLDLLDGKSDMLASMMSVFNKGSAAAGEATAAGAASVACGVVAIAGIVAIAAKKSVDIYNANISAVNEIGETWNHALMHAVEEEKNNCLDVFHAAADNLLDYVQQVHRERMGIGDTERRINEAKYAVADIKKLANTLNDKYADVLAENY
ncbi:MAG: hypothetical protein IJD78_06335 [Clostridia bacterium]|nr:hypothetical protein [Clostridia bacterium]